MTEDIKDVLKRASAFADQLKGPQPTLLIEFSPDFKSLKATTGDMEAYEVKVCFFTQNRGIVLVLEPMAKKNILAATNIPGAKQ